MIGYTREELSKARIDLEDIPLDVDILDVYPGLASLDFWDADFSAWGGNPTITKNLIIRYLNYFYSRELTCFTERYPDFYQRKAECARMAKFNYDPQTLQFSDKVKEMLAGKNQIVNRMMVSFLRHHYDTLWSGLVASYETYYFLMSENMANLGKSGHVPDPDEGKKFILFSDQIEKTKFSLLSGDKTKEISMALLISIEEDRLKLAPEYRAKLVRDGKSPLTDFDFYAPNQKNG